MHYFTCLNVVLCDDYTIDSDLFTQEEVNWMLHNLDWYATPGGVGYIFVSFDLTCDID